MCIAILSTSHPKYRLIIINNRDEFLHRPTSRANWWPNPHTHILSARDLARPVHGTWLGITKQGRIAVLTNYHEDTCEGAIGTCSRGAIVNSWLTLPSDSGQTTKEFVSGWMADWKALENIGGFNLVCGKVNEPLAILSNRVNTTPSPPSTTTTNGDVRDGDGIHWVATEPGQTVALSNTGLGDRSWDKVVFGEKLMKDAIAAHARSCEGQGDDDGNVEEKEKEKEGEGEEQLIRRLLGVLSVDTLPRLQDKAGVEDYIGHLPKSIFVPVIGQDNEGEMETETEAGNTTTTTTNLPPKSDGKPNRAYMQGLYGTQKQTVILVGFDGRVRYFERTLYEDDTSATTVETSDQSYEFVIGE